MNIHPCKPPTHHYSYSNPASQGALIAQSSRWPTAKPEQTRRYASAYGDTYLEPDDTKQQESAQVPAGHRIASAYSDRLSSWDTARYRLICDAAGGGDQNWAYSVPRLGDKGLINLGAVAFNLKPAQVHSVRVVHHYNVSNGYSCPTIEVIYKPEKEVV
jgi:hypothetical protein